MSSGQTLVWVLEDHRGLLEHSSCVLKKKNTSCLFLGLKNKFVLRQEAAGLHRASVGSAPNLWFVPRIFQQVATFLQWVIFAMNSHGVSRASHRWFLVFVLESCCKARRKRSVPTTKVAPKIKVAPDARNEALLLLENVGQSAMW